MQKDVLTHSMQRMHARSLDITHGFLKQGQTGRKEHAHGVATSCGTTLVVTHRRETD